jgi:DNA-binding Lrp family transcriptional regulator
MMKLDKLDRKIIAELDMNSRIPITQLAKAVRASREVVSYRLKVLTKKGIITGTQTFFNPAKIGYTIYRVLIRLDSLDSSIVNKFENYFINHKSIMWFAKLGGKWDYAIEFFAKNSDEFNNILNESLEEFEEFIRLYEVLIILEINCYKRRYIHETKKNKIFKIGGKIENLTLDEVDFKIIKELKSNASLSNSEIGERLRFARNTIKYRIEKLEKEKVIQGYKLFFHPQQIGFQSYKLLISMKNIDNKKENEFFLFSEQNKNIIFAHKNLGKWNYELEIEIEDMLKLQGIIIELRTRFSDSIIDYELFPILHDYKINLFPD